MIHQQGLSSRLFGLVAEPLRRNTSFFVFMYVLGGVLGILFNTVPVFGLSIHKWIYDEALVPLVTDRTFASLLYALIFIGINWSIGYVLYKKKIYIKI